MCWTDCLQIQSWTSQSDWKAFPKVKGTGPSPQVRIPDTEGGVGQMGKVKRESIEPLGTGFVLWPNQSKFQWSDR